MPLCYFGLQLHFAAHVASLRGQALRHGITHCTNLRRRFGLWGPHGSAAWEAYLQGVDQTASHEEVLRWTGQFQAQCGADYSPLQPFGCFSYEPPGPGGEVRIHFTPPAIGPNDGGGPLSRAQMGHRRAELAALVSHVRQHHPGATSVKGVSWLYNLPAYCRLFPADYAASAQLPSFALHLNGSSTWGQVVDHRQQVKPHLRDQLLANLPALDVAAPWRVFPLPALVASAPLACFF